MNIGIFLHDLSPAQIGYHVTKNTNVFLQENPDSHIICFYEVPYKPCLPCGFATMESSEIWGFDKPIISTSLSTTSKLLDCPTCPDIIFYVWDLEWIRMERKNFEELRQVYSNPRIELVARSAEHKQIIEKCWNVEVKCVIEDFDLNEFKKMIG